MEKRYYSNRVWVEIDCYLKPSRCKPFFVSGDLYKIKDFEESFTTLDLSVVIFNKKMDLWLRVKDT